MKWLAGATNWFARVPEKHWRRIVIGLFVVLVVAQVTRVFRGPQGDFRLHWEFGQRLVSGLYLYDVNGLDLPYLPFWAVAHAPLTSLPVHLAQICILPIFALAAWGLFSVLGRVSKRHWPVSKRGVFWGVMLTILFASRFWVRDILECGVNLALVALAWGAVWCWRKRRDYTGGALLGFAIALKLTPALFLAWFAWKRQWKISATTFVVTGLLMLTPLLFLGRETFTTVHLVWWHHASRGLLSENPVQGVLGEEPIQNMALRPALGRYLMHLPEGHNARYDHAWAFELGNLEPQTAGWVVRGFLGLLILGAAWQSRRCVKLREDPHLLWEAAGVSVMILLLSPITWGQHCVGVIPAIYLLVRQAISRQALPKFTGTVLGLYSLFILLFNRGFIGKQATYLLDSYYTTTWCLLGVLWLVMRSHAQEIQTTSQLDIVPWPDHELEHSQAA